MSKPNIIGLKKPLTEDQKAVVEVLKEALAQALEGEISSVAVIACMKTGYATEMAGRQASDLFMGAGSLQRRIINAVEAAGSVVQGRA